MINAHLLSLLIWVPVLGATFVLLAPNNKKRLVNPKSLAMLTVCLSLLLCVFLVVGFDKTTSEMQFVESAPWIPYFHIFYTLGVDGISMPLVVLTVFMSLIVVLGVWRSDLKRINQYLAAFLIMQGMITGVFLSLDAVLFYVFWEASLIPMFLIIGIWGSENRIYATIKFFLFTFLGSILMLIALIYLGLKTQSFEILSFYPVQLTLNAQILIFVAFFAAFAVKVPMWPIHTWLPDAHTEAPAGGSIILAALMLKMGTYGFLRFNLPITPDASAQLSSVMIVLALVAIVYIGFVAIAQRDMKKLIAYSSIAHMGFVILGIFLVYSVYHLTQKTEMAALGLEGAIVVMISHAFISGALFLGVGVLYDRLHTRQIREFGGVAKTMPVFAAFFMLFAMGNAGLPGTSGFVGEFMVILSGMQSNFWVAFLAATTLILAAAYTLWMYKRVVFGEVTNPGVSSLQDINRYEIAAFTFLAFMVLSLGIYPQYLLDFFHSSVKHLLDLSYVSKLPSL